VRSVPVAATETVAVFLKNRSEHSQIRAKYGPFMPNKNGRRSVYRVDGLEPDQVRQLGVDYVEPHRGQLRGYATQVAATFYGQGLDFEPDGVPHERHANVVKWTGVDHKDRLIAQHLAEGSMLRLYQAHPGK
jgi:hypothetical protein